MSRGKLDEKEKEVENLRQQIKHTKERIGDAEFALEHGDLSEGRRRELELKNKRRREDIARKQNEVLDVEEEL
ncbi:MAG: hypothetical protein GX208_03075 [Firmicutes bacterium]|nr:hypothetical protein [Bacillota bacterium]